MLCRLDSFFDEAERQLAQAAEQKGETKEAFTGSLVNRLDANTVVSAAVTVVLRATGSSVMGDSALSVSLMQPACEWSRACRLLFCLFLRVADLAVDFPFPAALNVAPSG